MSAMETRALSIARGWPWPGQALFGDLRVRYGIKMGLAGVLALFCTQLLRLPNDNWAILTVLVLMSAQFVGTVAFKALMRVTGTIAGALVGIWLVSDYTSTPEVFLPILFLVMAFASYKFGQVGARQGPYAYFLLGLTTLVIATDGVTAPDQAWQIGLDRTEEIVVGILSSLLVTTLVWPRYAREEFLDAGRAALKTVSRLVSAHVQAYLDPAAVPAEVDTLQQSFGQQLAALRNLQQAGARESTVFAARLSHYNAFLVALSGLFQAGLDLGRHPGYTWLLDQMRPQTETLLAAIDKEFDLLSAPRAPGEPLRPGRLDEAFATFEAKVNALRPGGLLLAAPVDRALALAGPLAALRSLCDELNQLRRAMAGLPRVGQPLPLEPKAHGEVLPALDWFWVKIAIKGGLAAVLGILCLEWLHPPGSGSFPLMAWLVTILGRPFLRAGGSGDLRAFQTALAGSLVLAGCAVLLLLTTPFLANYALMNLALFLVLFAFGFLTARIAGINFWMQVAFLTISAFVGLNPQEPVASQTIINTFLGLMFGIWTATVVGRLIWPVLPQCVLRDDLLGLCGRLQALLNREPHREKIQAQLAVLPLEALQAVGQLRMAGCSEEERARLAALVRGLQVLVTRMSRLVSRRALWREMVEPRLRLEFDCLDVEFKQVLEAFGACFRQGDGRRPLPALQGALAGLDQAVQAVRDRHRVAGQITAEAPWQTLELVDRYHATAEALEGCGRLLGSLQLQRYWGDYAL
jgi:uncharacterized membrane protein YccC